MKDTTKDKIMKDKIEEILDSTLRSFDEIEDIPEAVDKLLRLFKQSIESKKDEIATKLASYNLVMVTAQEIAQDIINILTKEN